MIKRQLFGCRFCFWETFRHPQDPEASLFRLARNRRCRVKSKYATKPQRHKRLPVNLFPVFIFGMQIFKICNRYRKQESTIYPKDLPASEGSGSVLFRFGSNRRCRIKRCRQVRFIQKKQPALCKLLFIFSLNSLLNVYPKQSL